jgi:hypothetical protein
MKMQCEKAQEQILTEDIVNSELESHLNECDDCREFQIGLGVMMTDQKKFEVPKALDEKILDFAMNNRPEKKTNKPVIPFMIMAIAAVVAILLSISLLDKNTLKSQEPSEVVDGQEVVNPLEQDKPKELIAETSDEEQAIDDVLNNLWGDDSIDSDLMAVESELFVLSAELYSN